MVQDTRGVEERDEMVQVRTRVSWEKNVEEIAGQWILREAHGASQQCLSGTLAL